MPPDSNYLLYLAFLIIAFLSWLSDTLKKRKAERGRSSVEEDMEEIEEMYQKESGTPPEDLQRFFELVTGRAPITSAPQPDFSPPPIPPRTDANKEISELSQKEKAALKRIKQRAAQKSGYAFQTTDEESPLLHMLRDKSKLRQAIVLKEILSKPKGLQF